MSVRNPTSRIGKNCAPAPSDESVRPGSKDPSGRNRWRSLRSRKNGCNQKQETNVARKAPRQRTHTAGEPPCISQPRNQDGGCESAAQHGAAVSQQTLPATQQSRLTKQQSLGTSQHNAPLSQHAGRWPWLQQSASLAQHASPSEQQSADGLPDAANPARTNPKHRTVAVRILMNMVFSSDLSVLVSAYCQRRSMAR